VCTSRSSSTGTVGGCRYTIRERSPNSPGTLRGVTLGQAALAAARTAGDRHGQAWTLHQLGVVQWLTGDYPAAAATLTEALELFRDLGHQRGQAWTLHQLGVVHRAAGDYPAATATLTEALELFRDVADRHGQAWALHDLGELLFLSSAYRQARGYFSQALSIARDLGIPVEEARALKGIRRCRAQEGNPGQRAADP
jgi:tetratricopeptide (TPR) repeat protein